MLLRSQLFLNTWFPCTLSIFRASLCWMFTGNFHTGGSAHDGPWSYSSFFVSRALIPSCTLSSALPLLSLVLIVTEAGRSNSCVTHWFLNTVRCSGIMRRRSRKRYTASVLSHQTVTAQVSNLDVHANKRTMKAYINNPYINITLIWKR